MPPRRSVLAAALSAVALAAGAACSGGTGGVAASTPPAGDATPSACPSQAGLADVPPLHPSVDGYDETTLGLVRGDGCTVELAVKVARTDAERAHGLMEVRQLPDGTGMLFVFDAERQGGFWMRNTLVPLDIAFVGGDGRIRAILPMQPCTGYPCPTYRPQEPYRWALEVPQGWFADVGVDEDWQLEVQS